MAMATQKWVTTLVGVVAVALAVWLVARNFHAPKAIGKDPSPHSPATEDAGGLALASDGGGLTSDGGAPLLLSDLLQGETRVDAGGGATMFDGTAVPPLPMNAPRQVRFGVVLISYDGAQPGPGTTHAAARSKPDARALALKLAATAQQDFRMAVQQGDAGSADDIGRVKLGILEPAPEYVLFTLPIDGVGGPVETPRGYWVVKRLE
jgi:hypothetical protein